MSKYQGGMIGSLSNTPSGTAYTGKANGMWSLPSHITLKTSSLWAAGQTKPNPPTIGTASAASSTSVSVAFIAPVQDGGSAITVYTVTSSGGQTATGVSSPIVVGGLTTGASYTFTVTATNALGTSVGSSTSNSVVVTFGETYFNLVSLLLNGDDLQDHSSSPKTITNTGSVAVNTSTKKYGTGSILFSGTNYLTVAAATDVSTIGSGDFTVECWLYQTSTPAQSMQIFDTRSDYLNGIILANGIDMKPYAYAGTTAIVSSTATTLNSWYHLAVARYNGVFKMFINGVQVASASSTTNVVGTNCYVGNSYDLYQGTIGYIDDLRFTKGVARYTATFTPPSVAFLTSSSRTIFVGNGVPGGGTASSNSAPDPNRSASAAFDGYTDNEANCWHSSQDAFSRYLRYDFGSGTTKQVNEYWLMARPSGDYFPSSWDFQGSNDGSTWTTLNSGSSVTALTGVVAGTTTTQQSKFLRFNVVNSISYRYYQWLIPSGNYIVIGEAVLLG